jgi:hypothetical protein
MDHTTSNTKRIPKGWREGNKLEMFERVRRSAGEAGVSWRQSLKSDIMQTESI